MLFIQLWNDTIGWVDWSDEFESAHDAYEWLDTHEPERKLTEDNYGTAWRFIGADDEERSV